MTLAEAKRLCEGWKLIDRPFDPSPCPVVYRAFRIRQDGTDSYDSIQVEAENKSQRSAALERLVEMVQCVGNPGHILTGEYDPTRKESA